jgi:hypothetical protein
MMNRSTASYPLVEKDVGDKVKSVSVIVE